MPLMESIFPKLSNPELLIGATTGPVRVIEVILLLSPLLKGNVLDNSPAPTVRFPTSSKVTGQVPQTPFCKSVAIGWIQRQRPAQGGLDRCRQPRLLDRCQIRPADDQPAA